MLLQWNSPPAFTHGLIKSLIPSKRGLSSLQIAFAQSKVDADPAVPKGWPSQCPTAPERACPFTCVSTRLLRLSRPSTPVTPFTTSIQLGSAFRHLSYCCMSHDTCHLPAGALTLRPPGGQHCTDESSCASFLLWRMTKVLVTCQRTTGSNKVGLCI